MDIVFLDANVLFSAAYRAKSGLARLWELDDAQLVTSEYAFEEAKRNLAEPAQRKRLEGLRSTLEVRSQPADRGLPYDVELPEKDRPILLAAFDCDATHLLTGDLKHFGPYYGTTISGVRILRPATYLSERIDED